MHPQAGLRRRVHRGGHSLGSLDGKAIVVPQWWVELAGNRFSQGLQSAVCGDISPEALSLSRRTALRALLGKLGAAGHHVGAGQKQEVKLSCNVAPEALPPSGQRKNWSGPEPFAQSMQKSDFGAEGRGGDSFTIRETLFQKHRWNTNRRPDGLREPNYTVQGADPSHCRAWTAWFSGFCAFVFLTKALGGEAGMEGHSEKQLHETCIMAIKILLSSITLCKVFK